LGIKWEFWGFGWPAVGGYGGEWPAVVFWWWGRRWVVVGVGGFGFREERTEEGLGNGCTAEGEMREKGVKSDLKAGHKRPKTEYVRTYKVRSTVLVQVSGVCVRDTFELT
jgi:hypothetical protein